MSPSDQSPVTEVAVGVLYDSGRRVLVNQRPEGKTFPGKWEFPGGKIEVGETASQALKREFKEELGITVRQQRPLISLVHQYDEFTAVLRVREVLEYKGNPVGREGQPIKWVETSNLARIDLLDANAVIVVAVTLPRVCLITDTRKFGVEHTLNALQQHVKRQRVLALVREKTMEPNSLRSFLSDVMNICHKASSLVCVHADCAISEHENADGIHFAAGVSTSRPSTTARIVGVSCHSSVEIQRANNQGNDYALLSPVNETASHPSAVGLGWHRFGQICDLAHMPVYALGGMQFKDFHTAIEHGAQGIAVLSAAWQEST